MVASIATADAPTHAGRKAQGKTLSVNRKCDPRERRFAQLVAQGSTLEKAYLAVSGTEKKETREVQGHRWALRPAVKAEIARLRAELTEEGTLSRAEKRHHLANITRADETETREKLTAIAIDNRMTGDDDPFRRTDGPEQRVAFFVIRVEEDEPREVQNVTPSAGEPIQLPPP